MSAVFLAILRARGIPEPVAEYAFAKPRRWRFDWAWPDAKVALEVEGGAWTGGRHTRPRGFLGDIEKYNAATVKGWRLVRVTPNQLCTLGTVEMLETLLEEAA